MSKLNLILTMLIAATVSCTKSDKQVSDELIIGFNPAENVEVVEAKAQKLIQLLHQKSGLKMKIYVATDFTALVEALRAGTVQLAFLPPFSFIQAERIAKAKVLLKSVRNGEAFFYSALITSKNFKSLDELKGKTIAWTDPASSSGHIMAKNMLIDAGIDPETFFGKQIFAGGHDAVVLAVLNQSVDVGATFSNDAKGSGGAWTSFLKSESDQKKIHILKISQPIPGDTLVTTDQIYLEQKNKVEAFANTMKELGSSEDGRKLLKDLYRIEAMIPADSKDYEVVRTAARRLKLF